MTARGYTTHTLVGAELGVTLTSGQQTEADGLIEEAEDLIDHETHRGWLLPSPRTTYFTVPRSGRWSTDPPIGAVTSLNVRLPNVGETNTLLVAGTDYELLPEGLLVIVGYAGYLGTLVYTHTGPVLPPSIQRAATLLVAYWMLPRLHPEHAGLSEISLSQNELTMKLEPRITREIPTEVRAILDSFAGLVIA